MALSDLTNLVAHWRLDGDLTDSHGAYDLTASGVGSYKTAGWIRRSGSFLQTRDLTGGYIYHADTADLSIDDTSCMIAAWVKFDTDNPAYFPIVCKQDVDAAGQKEFLLFYRGAAISEFRFQVNDAAGNVTGIVDTALSTHVRAGYWYLVMAWYDGSDVFIQVGVPDGDIITPSGLSAVLTGAVAGAVADATARFAIGAIVSGPFYADGQIQNVSWWKGSVLSAPERAELWNDGLGIDYPFGGAALPALATDEDIIDTFGVGYVAENQAIFRNGALASIEIGGTRYQAAGHWDNRTFLVVGVRNDGGVGAWGSWTLYRMNGAGGRPTITLSGSDSHHTISLGLDPDGSIHVSYDMHVDPLKYAKSNAAINVWGGVLTTGLSMLGTNETEMTYPTFFNDPAGILYFMFRDGQATSGNEYFYSYDEGITTWSAATGTGAAGLLLNGKVNGNTVYIDNAPSFDATFGAGGYMHLSYMWRDVGTRGWDYGYIRWDGTDWTIATGATQTIPVTQANDTPFDTATTLLNQNSIDVDSSGLPHIAYWKKDGAAVDQLYHAHYTGAAWVITQLTVGAVRNAGSPPLVVGRPRVIVNRSTDTVHIVYRDDRDVTNPGKLLEYASDPGDYTTWTQYVLYDAVVGVYEPTYDRNLWEATGVAALNLTPYFANTGNKHVTTFEMTFEDPPPIGVPAVIYTHSFAMPDYDGDARGAPLASDRAVWDVKDYATRHASDIWLDALLRHLPEPEEDGRYARDNGTYWISRLGILLSDLADWAQGHIIRGGVVDWEAYDARTDGFVLIGDGTDIESRVLVEADISNLDHTDPNAIHVNVVDEIHQIADKAAPVGADEIVIEDSSAVWAKKRVSLTNLLAGSGGQLIFSQVVDVAVENTTDETSVLGAGRGSKTIPADELDVGTVIRLTLYGYFSDTGTPTLNVQVKLGGTAVCSTGVITLLSGIDELGWSLNVDIACRTTGDPGTVVASGIFEYNDDSGHRMVKTTTTNVDTTAGLLVDVTKTWGAAAAGNTSTCQMATIELLKADNLAVAAPSGLTAVEV